jgi:hypothetical protein
MIRNFWFNDKPNPRSWFNLKTTQRKKNRLNTKTQNFLNKKMKNTETQTQNILNMVKTKAHKIEIIQGSII